MTGTWGGLAGLGVAAVLGGFLLRAPTVTQVIVVPAKVQLSPGEYSEVFCPFFRLSNGKVGLRTQDRGGACDTVYRYNYVKNARTLSQESQGVVDAQCLDWKATGGTFFPKGCDRLVP